MAGEEEIWSDESYDSQYLYQTAFVYEESYTPVSMVGVYFGHIYIAKKKKNYSTPLLAAETAKSFEKGI